MVPQICKEIYWQTNASSGTTIADLSAWNGDVNNLSLPVILSKRTVFSAGTHNGIKYSDNEIQQASKFTSLPLFLDHSENVQNQVGIVKNAEFQNGSCVADLVFFDNISVRKILLGAKWGISPRVEFFSDPAKPQEAKDSKFSSFSIVINPSDRTTMLNNQNTKINNKNMEQPPPTQEQGKGKETLDAKVMTIEQGTELLKMTDVETIKKRIRDIFGIPGYPYPAPAEHIYPAPAKNEELIKAQEEVNKLRDELNKIKETKAKQEIENARMDVVKLEKNLGIISDTNQANAELGKLNLQELLGMKIAYNEVQQFIDTSTNLDPKKSEEYEMKDNKPKGTPNEQLYNLLKTHNK